MAIVITLLLAAAAVALVVIFGAPAPATQESDDDFGTVDVYQVKDDGSLDPAATGLTAEVWATFQRVATPQFTADSMTQYRVGNAPSSDTLAYVYQDDDPRYWVLAANLATSEDRTQLIATLIHEYGHILTLGVKEVDPPQTNCATVKLDEGCPAEDSLLWVFNQKFWAPYGDSAPEAANSDADVAYDFYLAHEEDFVDDYAATNVIEDVAETFMTFVLEDEPTADTVVAGKISVFWNYPEFVQIRDRIRTEFAAELGLST